jgi:hypothetical protein
MFRFGPPRHSNTLPSFTCFLQVKAGSYRPTGKLFEFFEKIGCLVEPEGVIKAKDEAPFGKRWAVTVPDSLVAVHLYSQMLDVAGISSAAQDGFRLIPAPLLSRDFAADRHCGCEGPRSHTQKAVAE